MKNQNLYLYLYLYFFVTKIKNPAQHRCEPHMGLTLQLLCHVIFSCICFTLTYQIQISNLNINFINCHISCGMISIHATIQKWFFFNLENLKIFIYFYFYFYKTDYVQLYVCKHLVVHPCPQSCRQIFLSVYFFNLTNIKYNAIKFCTLLANKDQRTNVSTLIESLTSDFFLVANYSPFCKKYFEKANLLSNIPCFFFVFNYLKTETFALKIASIAYSMKGCLRFYTFIFWILPNLAKYTYMDDYHLSNITKLGGKKKKKKPNTKH